ncbi:MAG: hypothetical protein LBL86_09610, partial [Coriobacteriales bacterium]|nr:hypothetical protein [Coriobacteriales bacterium]
AIWATSVNQDTNAYYQNLYYAIVNPASTAPKATTWMSNPIASWGDSNNSRSNKGNVSTGALTIAGLEYGPEIIFGANKLTNWQDEDPTGAGSQTYINSYLAGGAEPGYAPVFTSNDATNIWAQVYTMGRLADVARGLMAAGDKGVRYGNTPMPSAVDYEKAVRGNLLWVASRIDSGAAQRKTVAYLYSIDGIEPDGSDGTGYFLAPQASGLLEGDDTGADPAVPGPGYAANNGTIGYGYRATLPLVTDTFDSGAPFPGGIVMAVENIYRANPACVVPYADQTALAGVDAVVYNSTQLTSLHGTTDGRNSSGVGINPNYRANGFALVSAWLAAHGFTGTAIAGDDFATSASQGVGAVNTTADGMSPLLYCQRNYTADKNAKAAWAFARVYPELYGGNPDATYCWWVDRVYHVNLADVPTVARYMLNKTGAVTYTQTTAASLEERFEEGRQWWDATGSADPYWSQFAYYNGSSRASLYSDERDSEEEEDVVGILAPSQFWTGPALPSSNSVSVTRVEQEMDNWCWAASAEMVGRSLYPQGARTQWDVVFDRAGVTGWHDQLLERAYGYIYDFLLDVGIDAGWALDQGGTLADIAAGIEHVACGTVSASSGAVLPMSSHYAEIDSGRPVVAFVEWQSGGAHAVVVSGYRGRGTSNTRLVLIDPAEGCDAILPFSYASLIAGTCTLLSGSNADYTHSVWVS